MGERVPKHGTKTEYVYRGCRCDECREAATAYQRSRRKSTNYRKNEYLSNVKYKIRQKYGLSVTDYYTLVMRQGGLCDICRKPDVRALAVDHCHDTERVRGLLCNKCNRALGGFGDNPLLIKTALNYLEQGGG
jgi:hypothetical protein